MTHLGDPEGFYKLPKDQQVAIVAHHRITTSPRKGATKKAGMNVHEAAAHFAQKEAIEKMKAKRAAAKGAENV